MRLDPIYLYEKGSACLWNRDSDKQKYQFLSNQMIELMIKKRGIGLAANQCGLRMQFFVMKRSNGKFVTCIHPKIESINTDWHGEHRMETEEEGCLSFPGQVHKVTRPYGVEVSYQDYAGNKTTESLDGIDARCWLHEYDHCQGITIIERSKGEVKDEFKYA